MASRESEPRRSMGPPQPGKLSRDRRRDPNPHTDYKAHFNRTKEKFDVVTTDQKTRRKELDRATLKQGKLQEELEYLLDAIAGEQLRARQLRQPPQERDMSMEEVYQPNSFYPPRDSSNVEEGLSDEQQQQQQQGDVPYVAAKRQRPSPTDTEDELLEIAGEPTKRFRDQ